jgi:hypothetical protein
MHESYIIWEKANNQRGDTASSTHAPPPPEVTPPTNGADGLLIQFEDGNMISEPVDVVPSTEPARDGRRVVIHPDAIGSLNPIEEAKSASQSPVIASHGEDGVETEGIETEVAGSIEPEADGEEARLLPDEAKANGTSDKGASTGSNGSSGSNGSGGSKSKKNKKKDKKSRG